MICILLNKMLIKEKHITFQFFFFAINFLANLRISLNISYYQLAINNNIIINININIILYISW